MDYRENLNKSLPEILRGFDRQIQFLRENPEAIQRVWESRLARATGIRPEIVAEAEAHKAQANYEYPVEICLDAVFGSESHRGFRFSEINNYTLRKIGEYRPKSVSLQEIKVELSAFGPSVLAVLSRNFRGQDLRELEQVIHSFTARVEEIVDIRVCEDAARFVFDREPELFQEYMESVAEVVPGISRVEGFESLIPAYRENLNRFLLYALHDQAEWVEQLGDFIHRLYPVFTSSLLTEVEARRSVFHFAPAILDYIKAHYGALEELAGLFNRINTAAENLRLTVMGQRSQPAVQALLRERAAIIDRYRSDLVTRAINPHFGVINTEVPEEGQFGSVQAFSEDLFDTFISVMRGGRMELSRFTDKVASTLAPRGFTVSDVIRAVNYFGLVAEPVLRRAYQEDPAQLLESYLQLRRAMERIATDAGSALGEALLRRTYLDFDLIFHEIKNKIVFGTQLQTLIFLDEQGRPSRDSMLLVEEEAEFLKQLLAAARAHKLPLATARAEELDQLEAKLDLLGPALDILMDMYDPAIQLQDQITEFYRKLKESRTRRAVQREEIDFERLAQQAYEQNRIEAQIKSLDYTFVSELKERVYVWGLRDELERVLRQIPQNSIKYTPENGQVRVRLYREGSRVAAEVTDTGIGIDEHDLGNLFKPFFRTESARDMVKTGTGTGLYEDRKTMQEHGGDIAVASEGPGQGSTFTIYMPVYRTEAAAP